MTMKQIKNFKYEVVLQFLIIKEKMNKQNFRMTFWGIICLMLVTIAISCGLVYYGYNQLVKAADVVGETTVINKKEMSVVDIMNMRAEVKEELRIDSIYNAIPDIVLATILQKHGASIDKKTVVDIYLLNKERYTELLEGLKVYKLYLNNDSLVKKSPQ